MTFWILIAIALFALSAIVALCFGGGCNSEPSEYLPDEHETMSDAPDGDLLKINERKRRTL